MANYNNSLYTYTQVLGGSGYYMQDDSLRYSEGVETMQTRLTTVGFDCGTPDGKFGGSTDTAVRNFQRENGLTVDGKAGKNTLVALNSAVGAMSGLYCSNSYLSKSQMKVNAQYILNYLRKKGWTKNAVCGMLGNMQKESNINPGIWQNLNSNNENLGFGLTQWTPSTKYRNWATANNLVIANMNSQLKRILYEVQNPSTEQYISTTSYPLSFAQFTTSTNSVAYLARAFLYNYEKPKNPTSEEAERAENATYWFNNLT